MPVPEFDAEEIVGAAGDRRVSALFAFWNRSRGPHMYPAQADLDLMSIPHLLPSLFIIDVLGGARFRYRFMGTRIDEHLGASLTGRTFDEFRSGRTLAEITNFFQTIADEGALGLLQTRLPSERFEWLVYTRLGLPLADDHVTINKIVGLFLFEPTAEGYFDIPTLKDIDQNELGLVKSRFGRLCPPRL